MRAKMQSKKINIGLIFLISLCLLVGIFLSLSLGSRDSSFQELLSAFNIHYKADDFGVSVIRKRIPRTILALLAGSSLAVSGSLMQSISRNPIADPSILGINTGASLAVVVGLCFFGISSSIAYISSAIVGGFLAFGLVYAIASSGKSALTPVKLALSGTATSLALNSLVSFLLLPNNNIMDQFRFWQVGSLGPATMKSILILLPFIAIAHLIAFAISPSLNAISLGDELAKSLGARVGLCRFLGSLASVILCASCTAICGPIAFVGLIVPHFVRILFGSNLSFTIPISAISGSMLLLYCDILARIIARPSEIEVGIITAIIGGPILIYVCLKKKGGFGGKSSSGN